MYFLKYSEHSKGYLFLGERDKRSVTEFEFHDATFLENIFSKLGDIWQYLSIFETHDQEISIVNILMIYFRVGSNLDTNEHVHLDSQLLSELNSFIESGPSGSNVPIDESINQSQQRQMSHSRIHCRHFEIEWEVLIITPKEDEPRNVKEAFKSLTKEKWLKVME